MVDVEEFPEEQKAIVGSDKRVEKYIIEPDNRGYGFFVFKSNKGPLPEELSGRYTSIKKAVASFEQFERTTKQSPASRQRELQEYREARRAKPTAKGQ